MKVKIHDVETEIFVAIISKGRPKKAWAYARKLGLTWATVYCVAEEWEEYRAVGFENVRVGGGLCESKNLAILNSFGGWTLILSDDIRGFSRVRNLKGKNYFETCSVREVIREVAESMIGCGAYLWGLPPVNNPLFFTPGEKESYWRFIIGDFHLIRPGAELEYNVEMLLKEDYDYTIQHLKKFGKVLRREDLSMDVEHYTYGGVADERKRGLEAVMCRILLENYPEWLRPNPKRENEVILVNKK